MRFGWLTAAAVVGIFAAPAAQAVEQHVRYETQFTVNADYLGTATNVDIYMNFRAAELPTKFGNVWINNSYTCTTSIGTCDFPFVLTYLFDQNSAPMFFDSIAVTAFTGTDQISVSALFPAKSLQNFGYYEALPGHRGVISGWLNVTPDSGVPEPATWALMILGFGAVGFAMRRQAGAKRTDVAYG